MNRDHSAEIEQLYELLASGFGFLFTSAAKTGNWSEPRSTALATICLKVREDASSPWLRAVRQWIESQQLAHGHAAGSWCEEIWDTAMCVLALKELGVSSRHPTIERALHWLASLFSLNGRGNWHDELWETSWALIAILRCGRLLPTVDVTQPLRWLVSLQGEDGNIGAPHYSAYFLLIHHFARKVDLSEDLRDLLDRAKERCVTFLLSLLRSSDPQRLWTGEAWSNGQILWALCTSRSLPVNSSLPIAKVISWFRDTQGTAGNWSDVEDTASAILGLVELLRVLSVESGVKEQEVDREIERRLRKTIPVPALKIRKPLLERDSETGYLSINLRMRVVNAALTILGFLLVGLLGFIANLMQILGWFWSQL